MSFPLQSNSLKVNGVTQSTKRGLRNYNNVAGQVPGARCSTSATRPPTSPRSSPTRRAATRSGDHKIRIFTIGMGDLVKMNLGTIPETSESVLMRLANDKKSADYNSAQLEGKYYYAQTAADLAPVFQQLQNQIIRLSK